MDELREKAQLQLQRLVANGLADDVVAALDMLRQALPFKELTRVLNEAYTAFAGDDLVLYVLQLLRACGKFPAHCIQLATVVLHCLPRSQIRQEHKQACGELVTNALKLAGAGSTVDVHTAFKIARAFKLSRAHIDSEALVTRTQKLLHIHPSSKSPKFHKVKSYTVSVRLLCFFKPKQFDHDAVIHRLSEVEQWQLAVDYCKGYGSSAAHKLVEACYAQGAEKPAWNSITMLGLESAFPGARERYYRWKIKDRVLKGQIELASMDCMRSPDLQSLFVQELVHAGEVLLALEYKKRFKVTANITQKEIDDALALFHATYLQLPDHINANVVFVDTPDKVKEASAVLLPVADDPIRDVIGLDSEWKPILDAPKRKPKKQKQPAWMEDADWSEEQEADGTREPAEQVLSGHDPDEAASHDSKDTEPGTKVGAAEVTTVAELEASETALQLKSQPSSSNSAPRSASKGKGSDVYESPVSILQISRGNSVFLFDLIHLEPQHYNDVLGELFRNPALIKTGYAFSGDLSKLRRTHADATCFDVLNGCIELEELGDAVFPGWGRGLSNLCKKVYGKCLSKVDRMSDWSRRPLTDRQVHYASLDAYVCSRLAISLGCTMAAQDEVPTELSAELGSELLNDMSKLAVDTPSHSSKPHSQDSRQQEVVWHKDDACVTGTALMVHLKPFAKDHDKHSQDSSSKSKAQANLVEAYDTVAPKGAHRWECPHPPSQPTPTPAPVREGSSAASGSDTGAPSKTALPHLEYTDLLQAVASAGLDTDKVLVLRAEIDALVSKEQEEQQGAAEGTTAQKTASAASDQCYVHVNSLTFQCKGKPVVALVEAGKRVSKDLLSSFMCVARRQVHLASPAKCTKIFGYTPGTVPPFGHRKHFDTLVDAPLLDLNNAQLLFGGGDLDHYLSLTLSELLSVIEYRPARLSEDFIVATPHSHSGDELMFLTDATLSSLVKWLRCAGLDTMQSFSTNAGALSKEARSSGRILLTSSRKFSSQMHNVPHLLTSGKTVEDRFQEVLSHFSITLDRTRFLSRCTKCNGIFVEASPDSVRTVVPDKVLAKISDYWRCDSCHQVVWQGPQYETMLRMFEDFFGPAPTTDNE
eukprot:m.363400 g.363400  ORF g.363400 m.363400 type:complete len:1101 (-) comp22375_c0_seq1:255-3557(-)